MTWAASLRRAADPQGVPSVIVDFDPGGRKGALGGDQVRDTYMERASAGGREDVADGADGDTTARVDHGQAIAGLLDLVEEVAGDDDGAPVPREGDKQVSDLGDTGGVESVRRFVEDDDFGIPKQRGGDPQPLPHPERVGGDRIIGPIVEPGVAEGSLDAARAYAVKPGEQRQVAASRKGRGEPGGLDERTHAFDRPDEDRVRCRLPVCDTCRQWD